MATELNNTTPGVVDYFNLAVQLIAIGGLILAAYATGYINAAGSPPLWAKLAWFFGLLVALPYPAWVFYRS